MCEQKTKDFLRNFGVGDTYRGFRYCIYSVNLAVEYPERLNCITKCIYPDVAKKYRTSVNCVERDIRTVAEVVWRNGGKEFFYRATGELLVKRPTNSKFLEILAHYIAAKELVAEPCQGCIIVADCKGQINRLEEEIKKLKKENKKLEDMMKWMHDLLWKLIKENKGLR